MKKWMALLAVLSALAIATPAVAGPASAAPPAEGRALVLVPLTFVKIDDLHFGTILPSAVSGTVTVPAAGGSATTTGGVTLITSDPVIRGRFAGAGVPGRMVVIDVTNPGTLDNGLGDSVTVLALTLDGSPLRIIDASRAFFFHVGGILQVGANQPEGFYQSEYNVTVQYL